MGKSRIWPTSRPNSQKTKRSSFSISLKYTRFKLDLLDLFDREYKILEILAVINWFSLKKQSKVITKNIVQKSLKYFVLTNSFGSCVVFWFGFRDKKVVKDSRPFYFKFSSDPFTQPFELLSESNPFFGRPILSWPYKCKCQIELPVKI